MTHISFGEAQAWSERTKLDLGTVLEEELEDQLSTQVLSRVATAYDTSGWVSETTTPKLLRTVIAMQYVAYIYARTYSDNTDGDSYSTLLLTGSEAILQNIIDGITPIDGVDPTADLSEPVFYPTDLSSASTPTPEDSSLGGAKFSMGTIF
jgi:hypothetical protein